MVDKEIYGLRAAAKEAGVSHAAIHRWCAKYPDLARMEGGRMVINRGRLKQIAKAMAVLRVVG